jgi:hypothetical protein
LNDAANSPLAKRVSAFQDALINGAYKWFSSERNAAWDHGRQAAITSLMGVVDYLESLGDFKRDGVTEPLVQLLAALNQVQEGRAHPMLTPARQQNRTKDNVFQATLKGWAAAAMELGLRAHQPWKEAAGAVADELTQAGCRLRSLRTDKFATFQTVKNWRQTIVHQSPQRSQGARAFAGAIAAAEKLDLAPADAMKRTLAQIRAFVQQNELYEI